jgi:MFS family permease
MFASLFGGITGALRNRDYRRFWLSNFISTIGRWLYRTAVGWLVWELTKSTSWLGVVAFSDAFPMVVFSVFAGAISDQVGCVRVMRISQSLSCLVLGTFGVLALTGLLTIEMVLVLVPLYGSLEAISTPPRTAVVHWLVPKGDLAAAIALSSASFNACRVLGPSLAGVLIVWFDPGTVIAISALALLQLFIVLLIIPKDPGRGSGRLSFALFRDVREGVIYVARHPGIRYVMLLLGGTGLFIRPFMDMLPGFAGAIFKSGPEGLALLLASIGAGALCACLWLARRGRIERLTYIVTNSLVTCGLALIVFTFAGYIWLAAFVLTFVGFFMLVTGVGSQTLIQTAVDASVRARVMSLYIVISFGLPAIGSLTMGRIAATFGLQHTIAAGAALTILIWLWARTAYTRFAPTLEQPDLAVPVAPNAR